LEADVQYIPSSRKILIFSSSGREITNNEKAGGRGRKWRNPHISK